MKLVLFHSFIFVLLVYFFYFQSKYPSLSLNPIPSKIKVGIPFYSNHFAYQTINGEFEGKSIELIKDIFKEKNITLEFSFIENNNYIEYDCIINIEKNKIIKDFLFSDDYCDTIEDQTSIQKSNDSTIIKNILILQNDILSYVKIKGSDNKNIFIVNSLEEGCERLNDSTVFIFDSFHSSPELEEKMNKKGFFVKTTAIPIQPLCMLFTPSLYNLLQDINHILRKKFI